MSDTNKPTPEDVARAKELVDAELGNPGVDGFTSDYRATVQFVASIIADERSRQVDLVLPSSFEECAKKAGWVSEARPESLWKFVPDNGRDEFKGVCSVRFHDGDLQEVYLPEQTLFWPKTAERIARVREAMKEARPVAVVSEGALTQIAWEWIDKNDPHREEMAVEIFRAGFRKAASMRAVMGEK